jgi:hypothetical protein
MKKYIFIIIALAFVACENTFFVGGTVTDNLTRDSINGIEMGLYVYNQNITSFTDMKWSDLELIATAKTNNDGFFSMELDDDFSMSRTIFLPLVPKDSLSVNAQYTPKDSDGLQHPQYGTNGKFKLQRPSHVLFHLVNFTQEKIEVRCGDRSAATPSLTVVPYIYFEELVTGMEYTFDFYEVINSNYDTKYLGSCTHYVKKQLPIAPEKVFWETPI